MTNQLTRFLFLLIAFASAYAAKAQWKQTLRGTVVDQVLQSPLPGADVQIAGTTYRSITDSLGQFYFSDVPVGNYSIQVTYIGYKTGYANNVSLISGKELVLTVGLELSVSESNVFVRGASKKNRPINERSLISARAFTVEETQKYAAAVNDPLRMATNFAGVVSADDGSNLIVIRGNTPSGVLWRMEGIDVPNPNHFANTNSSGGGISILSSALLSNSDFLTGAFASEYGNALSGVMDMKLRKGNNQKKEYTLQAGLLGLNLAAEGPSKLLGKGGSYLVNYRYSTLSLLDNLGVNIGDGSTKFQDLSFNVVVPTRKAGQFTLFGFGGLSSQDTKAVKDSSKWIAEENRYANTSEGNTGFAGLTHQIRISNKTLLKSAVGFSYSKSNFYQDYLNDQLQPMVDYSTNNINKKITLTSTINHRFNNKHALRSGIIVNQINFNFLESLRDNHQSPLEKKLDAKGGTQTVQTFAEWQAKPLPTVTFNVGAHTMYLASNKNFSLEPRTALKWDVSRTGSLSFGYGLHSQLQGLGVYFAEVKLPNGKISTPNKHLRFTRSHHFVAGFQQQLATNLRLKTEIYYQKLVDVPVGNSDTSALSTLNLRDGYLTEELVNKGTGKNYGIEISVEKYLSKGSYFMWSNSIYQSKYTALDGIERNTAWNGKFATNLVAGKDWVNKDGRRTFGFNVKTVFAGGFRTTPVDISQSIAQGTTVYKEKLAFTEQLPDYFRTDVRMSITWNRSHATSTLSLDFQNIMNRQNVQGYYYDTFKKAMVTAYQTGLIPILNYKVELEP